MSNAPTHGRASAPRIRKSGHYFSNGIGTEHYKRNVVDYDTEPYVKNVDADSLIEAEVPADDQEYMGLGVGEHPSADKGNPNLGPLAD